MVTLAVEVGVSLFPTGVSHSPGRNHDYVDDAYYTYSDGDIKDDGIVGISFGALPSSYGQSLRARNSIHHVL